MNNYRTVFSLALILFALAGTALALPLNEGFEEALFPPPGWTTFQNADGDSIWVRRVASTYAHSGNGMARSQDGEAVAGTVERWLVTPPLSVTGGADQISYWVRTLFSFVVGDDTLFVKLSTTDTDPASFTTELAAYSLGSGADIADTYYNGVYNLAAYDGQTVYVAFVHRDSNGDDNEVYIDDVTGPEAIAPPYEATTPTPQDGDLGTDPATNLSWVNGTGTTTVDLYLAQTLDSVNNNEPVAKKVDNVLVEMYDPPVDLAQSTTYYWKVVTRNSYGDTDSPVWTFTTSGTPLAGTYDIGGATPDYPNFSEAVAALYSNGISAAVTFNVYGTDYEERIEFIGAIPGADAGNRVTFNDASGTARILDSSATTSSIPVVLLNGCSFVTWDGIDIWASVETDNCLQMQTGSTDNIFSNCQLLSGVQSTVSHSIRQFGNGCDNNLFQNLDCFSGNETIYFSSGSGPVSSNCIVENCTVNGGKKGIYIANHDNLIVRGCDVQANQAANSSGYLIDVEGLSGSTVHIYGNQLHGLVSSGTPAALRANGGTGSTLDFYNNFIYDIQNSGTASFYGVYASSGQCNFYFNSMRIPDLVGTGTTACYYKSSTTHTCIIQNNIFYSAEATNTTRAFYGLSTGYSPAVLDNNAYYNDGGANYVVYYAGTGAVYATLADLQANTAFEVAGVEGDPGFTSAADLHILNTVGLVSNGGAPIGGITDDIDGDTRSATPDIGADEYNFLAPSNDYAVTHLVNAPALLPELTNVTTMARVANIGSDAQTDVPVRLFYNGTQYAEVLVSLASENVDTVELNWTTPVSQGPFTLEVQSFLAGDANPNNDSATAEVQIVGVPMHGDYDIGGGNNDYADIASAVTDLTLRSVDGAVTFHVYPQTYGPVSIGEISGVSAANTVTFQAAGALLTPPEISGAATVLSLVGTDYFIFDGIDVIANTNGRVVQLSGGATNNTFTSLSVTGNDVSSTSTYGIETTGGGNDDNLIDNVIVSGAYYAVRLAGTSSASDVANEVRNCTISEGKYAVYLTYQSNTAVHDCDIQPGWNGANTEVYGIYCTSHSSGTESQIWANQIHNIRSQSTCNGIYGSPGSGSFLAHNNFIYDFQGPTGTSVLYGLRAAGGSTEWYFNSVLIGDVATTGNIYGFYITGSSTSAILENNVIEVDEPVEDCWSIYVASGTLTSNYNAFYSSGPGALYYVGRESSVDYATLALWQGTGHDANSVYGNPGFLNSNDLHIIPTFGLLNGAGLDIGGITTDIDGEVRGSPPDIGADEYAFTSLPHDYGVNQFIGLNPTYVTNVPVVIQAEVENYGSSNETDVPVRLYYNDVQQDEVLLSLNSAEVDTVSLDWTPPVTGFEIGELKVKAFCPGDGFSLNDSTAASVTIVGPPMSGTYDLGGGNMNFANFTEAVSALALRGIDGEVIMDCYDGTYNENIEIPPISGANFTDRVIFQAHPSALDDIVNLTASGGAQVLYINGADYITFDGINIIATGSCNVSAQIDNDADYITLMNLAIEGRDSTNTSTRGVRLTFNSNDNCTIDNVTLTGCFYGFRNESGSGGSDNWEIKNSTVSGASYCVYLDDVNGRIHDNDFQPHGYASTSAYGVYISFLTADDTVQVYNNRFHNFRHTSTTDFATVAGVYSTVGATSYAYVYNNFFYDWETNGPDIFGYRGSTGNTYVYNNSIRMNDVENAGDFAGIYVSTGNTAVINNIIEMDETTNTCYGIWRAGGTLVQSDNNCFYGTGAGFVIGRDGTGEYASLGDWQTLGYDANSIAGEPGYLSASDLHLDPSFTLCNAAGQTLAEVTDDIDGDPRGTPPDIGADEYNALVAPEVVDSLTIAVDITSNNVMLRWTPSANANSYKIYADITPGFVPDVGNQIGHTGSLTFTHVGGLTGGIAKFYVVLASTDDPPALEQGRGFRGEAHTR